MFKTIHLHQILDLYRSGLIFEGDMVPFMREKDAKVSSALTEMRRNARTKAKLLSEPFVSFSLMKGPFLISTKNLKTQTRSYMDLLFESFNFLC